MKKDMLHHCCLELLLSSICPPVFVLGFCFKIFRQTVAGNLSMLRTVSDTTKSNQLCLTEMACCVTLNLNCWCTNCFLF